MEPCSHTKVINTSLPNQPFILGESKRSFKASFILPQYISKLSGKSVLHQAGSSLGYQFDSNCLIRMCIIHQKSTELSLAWLKLNQGGQSTGAPSVLSRDTGRGLPGSPLSSVVRRAPSATARVI